MALFGALAWLAGVGIGMAVAISHGPYVPTWGAALAFPSSALILSFGAYAESRDDQQLTHLLRLGLGFGMGFLSASISTTFGLLNEQAQIDAVGVHHAREVFALVLPRWGLAFIGLLIGAAALTARNVRGWLEGARRRELADRGAVARDLGWEPSPALRNETAATAEGNDEETPDEETPDEETPDEVLRDEEE